MRGLRQLLLAFFAISTPLFILFKFNQTNEKAEEYKNKYNEIRSTYEERLRTEVRIEKSDSFIHTMHEFYASQLASREDLMIERAEFLKEQISYKQEQIDKLYLEMNIENSIDEIHRRMDLLEMLILFSREDKDSINLDVIENQFKKLNEILLERADSSRSFGEVLMQTVRERGKFKFKVKSPKNQKVRSPLVIRKQADYNIVGGENQIDNDRVKKMNIGSGQIDIKTDSLIRN